MLEQQFDEYKAEYSRVETTDERKNELIVLMQGNLKRRWGHDNRTISCLDGQDHSLDSENVKDLYAIDGFLKSEEKRNQMSAMCDRARQETQDRNIYGPNNPYPNY